MVHTSEVGFSKFEADNLIRDVPLQEKFHIGKNRKEEKNLN